MKSLPDQAERYFRLTLKRLNRRTEHKSCAPTKEDLRHLIEAIRLWDIEQFREWERSLLLSLSHLHVDLLELAAGIFWGQYWHMKIKTYAEELKLAQEALKKAKSRAKHRKTIGVLRCSLRVDEAADTLGRASFVPGIKLTKRIGAKGRRQDVPIKLAHLHIARYFLTEHPQLLVDDRQQLTRCLLDATGSITELYRPSFDALRIRDNRLRKESRFFPRI